MPTYQFSGAQGHILTLHEVKTIITDAGYDDTKYNIYRKKGTDDYIVEGKKAMSVDKLQVAAANAGIDATITQLKEEEIGSLGAADRNGAAGTPYEVTITMTPDTVTKLIEGRYFLYGFKAVQSAQGGGAPAIWIETQTFSTKTRLWWTEEYQAYTSNSEIIANGRIEASFYTDIKLGQVLDVIEGGTGDVFNDGTPGAISINNTTDTPFTCGISQMQNGTSTVLCAFPLYGGGLDLIVPIQKILLIFATLELKTGTVIFKAYSRGIFIDLTSENKRSVDFDINKGWTWDGRSWAQQIPAKQNIVPLLIEEPSSTLVQSYLAVQ
jgi:hypothetical protein